MTQILNIFVTVGTHEDPFDRLVGAAEQLARHGHHVVLQKGTSQLPTPECEASAVLTLEAMNQAFERADVVVCHGGPSTLLEAAAHGHVPILVPRRAVHSEHVDDHQLWFARRMTDRVHVVEDPSDLLRAVQEHAAIVSKLAPFGPDAGRTERFAAALEALCHELVVGGPSRPRRHGRFTALRRWMKRAR